MEKEKFLLKIIEHSKLGKIYNPIVEDIIKMGDVDFESLILPFVLSLDNISLNMDVITQIEQKLNRTFTIFDYLMLDKDSIEGVLKSLRYFYKTEDIHPYFEGLDGYILINFALKDNKYIPSNESIVLNYQTWDELSLLIKELMLISGKKEERKVTVEHEENNALLEEYLRLQKQAEEENKKLAQKNITSTHDIITIVAKDCGWDYDRVLNMTYYRLVNAYRTILYEDKYKSDMMIYTSYKYDTSNMKVEHWIDSIKKG